MSLILLNFILFILAVFLMPALIVLIHELGHAIPGLLFTKKIAVDVYIGTFNDKKNTFKLKLGRLNFFIKHNSQFFKIKGICKMTKPITSFYKSFIFISGGLLTNLVSTILVAYYLFIHHENEYINYGAILFIYYSLWIFFGNVIPRTTKPENGKFYQTDGSQLVTLFKQKKYFIYLDLVKNHVENNDYQSAIIQLQKAIELGYDVKLANETLATLYIYLKNFKEAEKIIISKVNNGTSSANDFHNLSYISIKKLDFNQAISLANKALELNKDSQPLFNLLGYCLIETNNLEEAENVLLKALDDEQSKSYALNNLGYIKIIQDKLEEGFLLIEQSLQLNTTNGYAYRNRGIYHFKKEQFALAKIDFEKANEIEPDVLHLDEWMQKLQYKLNETQLKSN